MKTQNISDAIMSGYLDVARDSRAHITIDYHVRQLLVLRFQNAQKGASEETKRTLETLFEEIMNGVEEKSDG